MDDLILFCKADRVDVAIVNGIINTFCGFSSWKINRNKAQAFFSLNTPGELATAICEDLEVSRVDDLGKYLGMSIFHQIVLKGTFNFVVEKVRNKVSGWQARNLSLAGRITFSSFSHSKLLYEYG